MPQKYKLMSTGEIFLAEVLKHDNGMELAHWCHGKPVTEIDAFDDALTFMGINVPTLTGTKRLSEGDYLVQSENGYFHVVARFEFEQTYKSLNADDYAQVIMPGALKASSEEVPLVQYDEDGRRRIIGRAKVSEVDGGLRADVTITQPTPGMRIEDFDSLSVQPVWKTPEDDPRKQHVFNWLSIKDEREE